MKKQFLRMQKSRKIFSSGSAIVKQIRANSKNYFEKCKIFWQ